MQSTGGRSRSPPGPAAPLPPGAESLALAVFLAFFFFFFLDWVGASTSSGVGASGRLGELEREVCVEGGVGSMSATESSQTVSSEARVVVVVVVVAMSAERCGGMEKRNRERTHCQGTRSGFLGASERTQLRKTPTWLSPNTQPSAFGNSLRTSISIGSRVETIRCPEDVVSVLSVSKKDKVW